MAEHNEFKHLPPVLLQVLVLQRPSGISVILLEYKESCRRINLGVFLEDVEENSRKLKLEEDTEDDDKRGLRRCKRRSKVMSEGAMQAQIQMTVVAFHPPSKRIGGPVALKPDFPRSLTLLGDWQVSSQAFLQLSETFYN